MANGTLQVLSIVADGLSAQRQKMNVAAENIAHAETTRTPEGGPYRRQSVVLSAPESRTSFTDELQAVGLSMRRTRPGHRLPALTNAGNVRGKDTEAVRVETVKAPESDVRMLYDPTHPDANADGYVAMPDVEIVTEMVDLMTASRAYEANLTAADAVKSMVERALSI